jgi:hypothetical protein
LDRLLQVQHRPAASRDEAAESKRHEPAPIVGALSKGIA